MCRRGDAALEQAREAVAGTGAHVLAAAAVHRLLGADETAWERFAGHWADLRPDRYAAASGTRRLRRYGRFLLDRSGDRRPLPHAEFRQPVDTNRLFPDAARDFAPLTAAFIDEPVFDMLLPLLATIAGAVEDAPRWLVHVHPFRVVGTPDSRGDAAPEGRHQDGVTLVSSLLVDRRNAVGGRSTVSAPDGRELLATTLSEPGALLVGDDRRTWHSVSPIRPVDPDAPAHRDVLVVTLTSP